MNNAVKDPTKVTYEGEEYYTDEILELFHEGDCETTVVRHNETRKETSENGVNSWSEMNS